VTVWNSRQPLAPRFRAAYSSEGAMEARTPSITRAAMGKKAMVWDSHRPCQPMILYRVPRRVYVTRPFRPKIRM
jgi:hypothetical protein